MSVWCVDTPQRLETDIYLRYKDNALVYLYSNFILMSILYSQHMKFEMREVGSKQNKLKPISAIISIYMKAGVIYPDCSYSPSLL